MIIQSIIQLLSNLCREFLHTFRFPRAIQHKLSLTSIPPSLFTIFSLFPNCHLITFLPLQPYHLIILPPSPTCHLAPVIHLFHLSNSLLNHLSQFTCLPTTNRHLQNSNLLSVFFKPLMKPGW